MGLFDRFKRRVKEVANEVDSEALTVNEDSAEGRAAIESSRVVDEDWDEVPEDDMNALALPDETSSADDDWDDWDLSLIHI